MRNDAIELLRGAFEAAKKSGKPDWHRMTVAVLKNRLLNITQGKFTEADYGANNISEFVTRAPEVVRLDKAHYPPVVEWIAGGQGESAPLREKTGYARIRPDLWQAVMDYSSGSKYVWDKEKGLARSQVAGDAEDLLIPTLSVDEYSKWQNEFLKMLEGTIGEDVMQRVRIWTERKVSPRFLPSTIQSSWNEYLKMKIEDLLTKWFASHHIERPEKLTVVAAPRMLRLARHDNLEELRRFVIECVRVMNEQELRELRLPPLAALRARK